MEAAYRIDVRRRIAVRVGYWLGPGVADSSRCLSRGTVVSRRADPARRRYVGVRCAFPKLGAYRKRVVELLDDCGRCLRLARSEEHTSELQSLMRISYAVFCLKKKNKTHSKHSLIQQINNRLY